MRTPCCHSTFYWDHFGWAHCCKCDNRADHPTDDFREGPHINTCECHAGPNTLRNLAQQEQT